MKIQSDEISMERRAGFAHAAPNCPNLAQGAAERKKTKKRRNLVERACVSLLAKGVCHSRRSKGVCHSGLIVF